ncbi:hypothetical protein BH23VER1_BH23VER1_34050 [soil metagenome]
MENAKSLAAEQAGEAKAAAREARDHTVTAIRDGASDAAHEVADTGRSIVTEQAGKLATKVAEYERAARAASEKLHADGDDVLGQKIDHLASRLSRTSSYLRDAEPRRMWRDAEDLTRRRPELVLGGLLLGGLALGRFLKADRPDQHQDDDAMQGTRAQTGGPTGGTLPYPGTGTQHPQHQAPAPVAAPGLDPVSPSTPAL